MVPRPPLTSQLSGLIVLTINRINSASNVFLGIWTWADAQPAATHVPSWQGAPAPQLLQFALLQAGQQCLSLVRTGTWYSVLLRNLKPPLTLKPLAGGTGGMGTGKYGAGDRKSTRLNSSHGYISYAVFC